MKIGISSYSFSKLYNKDGFTLFNAIDAAAEIGFDCIEVLDLNAPAGESLEDYAKRVRERTEKAGIELNAYMTYADFLYGSGGDIRKETERVTANVDTAVLLGAKLMRHDSAWGFRGKTQRNWQDAIEIIAPAIREVTEYAEGKGVCTMCENHGTFIQDSVRMEALVKAVGHPNFGLLVDMGNFLCADEDPAKAVAATAPYAFHAHVKDFLYKPGSADNPGDGWFGTRAGNYLRGTVAGHGVVPVRHCMNLLKKYAGDGINVALEFEGLEETMTAIKLGYKLIKNIL